MSDSTVWLHYLTTHQTLGSDNLKTAIIFIMEVCLLQHHDIPAFPLHVDLSGSWSAHCPFKIGLMQHYSPGVDREWSFTFCHITTLLLAYRSKSWTVHTHLKMLIKSHSLPSFHRASSTTQPFLKIHGTVPQNTWDHSSRYKHHSLRYMGHTSRLFYVLVTRQWNERALAVQTADSLAFFKQRWKN